MGLLDFFKQPDIKNLTVNRDVNGMIKAVSNKDAHIRVEAVEALGELRDSLGVEPLVIALNDSDQDVRDNAALALGKIGDIRAVEPLIASLRKKETAAIVKALGELGDNRALQSLIDLLQTGRSKRKWHILYESLEKLGWQPPMDKHGLMYHLMREQRKEIIEMGPAAIKPLNEIIKNTHERSSVLRLAVDVLIEISKEDAIPCLKKLHTNLEKFDARNKDKVNLRHHVEIKLVHLGAHDFIDFLVVNETYADEHIAKASVDELLRQGSRAAGPLITCLQGEDPNLQYGARRILLQMGTQVIEPLKSILHNEKTRSLVVELLQELGVPKDELDQMTSTLEEQEPHDIDSGLYEKRPVSRETLEDEFYEILQQETFEMAGSGYNSYEIPKLATNKAAEKLMRKYGIAMSEMMEIIKSAMHKHN